MFGEGGNEAVSCSSCHGAILFISEKMAIGKRIQPKWAGLRFAEV